MSKRLPNIIVGLAVCPFCDHPEHTVRSTRRLDTGDFLQILRYVTCDDCGRRFTITAEDGPELRITNMNFIDQ